MRALLPNPFLLLAAVVACAPAPGPTDAETDESDVVDDTDDTDDSSAFGDTGDTDTDVDDDTEETDTGLPPDTDIDTDTDVDTDVQCILGEVPDCAFRCFPEYMLGDGTCDDGTTFQADFACDRWSFDRGDCVDDDTDTDVPTACAYSLRFVTRSFASEIGWSLADSQGRTLAAVQPGGYASDNTAYVTDLFLADGTYRLTGTDSFGDGWHGAFFQIINPRTQAVVLRGDNLEGAASRYTYTFDTTCAVPTCEVDVITTAATGESSLGWELGTVAGGVGGAAPGTLPAAATTSRRIEVGDGIAYDLRLLDGRADGWTEGSRLEVRYPGGLLLLADRLLTGSTSTFPFRKLTPDCGLASEPALDAPGPEIELDSCRLVRLVTTAGTTANEVSWTLQEVPAFGRPIAELAAGALPQNVPNTLNADLRTGRYVLQMRDAGRNAWGGSFRILDASNATLFETTHPGGSQTAKYFDVRCPEPADTDETDETDAPPGDCLPGAVADCLGVCWALALVGDGVCDDGDGFAPDFACDAFGFDGGDCATPP